MEPIKKCPGFVYFILLTVYTKKTIQGIFLSFFISKATMTKVNFRFNKHCCQGAARLICERAIFAQDASVVFSSSVSLYIEKNSVEKLLKVIEIELKTYTSVGPKFAFEKIESKVLHYIQHEFIPQHLELSKDQVSIFKSLVIN